MIGEIDLAGGAFAEAEAELEALALAKTPLSNRLAALYKRSWACLFGLFGSDCVFRREVAGGPPIRIPTKAVFRPLLEKEIVGEILATDVGVLVYPEPLLTYGLAMPTRKGDKIVRNPSRPGDNLLTAIAAPDASRYCIQMLWRLTL